MPRGPELTREQIAAISSLCVAGKCNKDISSQTGIPLRSVQRWTRKCKDAGGSDPPLQIKRTGPARKTSKRTLKVIQRQVEAEPRITAKELKEKNPLLLQTVSVRTIQRRLRDDLCYGHRAPRRTDDGEWMREAEKTEQAQQKLRTRKVKHVAMPEPNPLSKFALKEEKEQDAEMVKAWFLTMEEESPCLDGSMFAEIKQEDTDEISVDIKEEPIDFKTEGLHNGLKLPVETMEEARLCNMKEESPSLDSSAATGRELLYNVGEMTSSEEWNWDSNKTMSLIQQYERFPELWNVSLVHYRNKEKKASAIKEIAKTLKIPESEITRKWHNLRYQMNSEMRKIEKKKNGMGTDEVTVKSTWKFFDALHFMIGCNTPQGITSANMDLSSSTNIVNEDVTQPSEQFQDDVILSTSGTQHDKDKISGKNKKAAEMEVETALKTAIDVLDKPQDDYSVFGDYVASELRQLRSDENRKKLKRTITKAIIEMGEMEDLQYSSSSSTPIPPLSLNEPHSSDGASIHHGTTSQL